MPFSSLETTVETSLFSLRYLFGGVFWSVAIKTHEFPQERNQLTYKSLKISCSTLK